MGQLTRYLVLIAWALKPTGFYLSFSVFGVNMRSEGSSEPVRMHIKRSLFRTCAYAHPCPSLGCLISTKNLVCWPNYINIQHCRSKRDKSNYLISHHYLLSMLVYMIRYKLADSFHCTPLC